MKDILKNINTLIQIPIKSYIFKQIKCLVLMMAYTVCSLIFPGFISLIVDEGIKKQDINKILFYCFLMLGCGVLMIVFQYLQQMSFYKLAQEIVYNIKHTIFEKISERNLKFWSKHQVGDVLRILENDIDNIQTLLTSTISNLVINFFVVIGITSVLLIINPVIGITVFGLSLVFAHSQRKYGQKVQNGMADLREKMGDLSTIINEALNNMTVIQMADLVSLEKKRFNLKNKSVIKQFICQMKRMTVAQLVGLSFNVFGILIVLAVGTFEMLNERLSVGILFSMTIYVQRLYGPIVSLGTAYVNIKNTKPMIDKVQDILRDEDLILDGDLELKKIQGKIEFVNVSFKYENNWVLQNFNLRILPNSKLGLIGENGSGKSTIIKLLSKLCGPQEGTIFIDGVPIDDISYDSLKSNMALIPQGSFLPCGKLKEIMGVDNKEKEKKMYELMQKLGIPISKFPKGIESEISENMNNLSGGEVQKLCLIRGLLQNKKIYILDEPTAAMDMISEKDFCNIIKEYLAEKTTIIVTHRKTLLSVCDRIVELKCEDKMDMF